VRKRKAPRLGWHLRRPTAYYLLAAKAKAQGYMAQADAYLKAAAMAEANLAGAS
jgi:hypothetical protein